jgi:hypothetical protein
MSADARALQAISANLLFTILRIMCSSCPKYSWVLPSPTSDTHAEQKPIFTLQICFEQ